MNLHINSSATVTNGRAEMSFIHTRSTLSIPFSLEKICRDAIMAEAGALLDYAERLGTEFVEALQIIHDSAGPRSEEHTSELQSLMRISYAVFCLKKKKKKKQKSNTYERNKKQIKNKKMQTKSRMTSVTKNRELRHI